VDIGRFSDHRRNLYSPDWSLWATDYKFNRTDKPLGKPPHLSKIISVAEAIGAGIDFARVDLYAIPFPPFVSVGEITMTPGGGMERILDAILDRFLGSQWKVNLQ
jgi:hypothetical protein